ncbi:MAG: DUF1501 domain-containing protein [Planctomycetia bacterium]|nr:DUF1501 domain-containing protein [Planctomycetia bacterium]
MRKALLNSRENGFASRRQFLQSSGVAIGAIAGGRTLSVRAESGQTNPNPPAKRAIVILLQGGCSQLDTWDMKPEAPSEYRGEFDSIATATAGYRVCEHMPRLAAMTQRFNVLRSVHHGTPSHEAAIHWVLTGYDYPGANVTTKNRNDAPSVGSIVAKVRGASRPGLPAYVCVPDKGQLGDRVRYAGAHHLGMAFDPFESGPVPTDAASAYQLPPYLVMSPAIDVARFQNRQGLLQRLDNFTRAADNVGAGNFGAMTGIDQFRHTALEMVSHPVTRDAFDLSQETIETRQRYGNHKLGQRALLARRLAEAGVPFTLVNFSDNQDWDTHVGNFASMKNTLLPRFDQAVSTLLDDLTQRGLIDTTLVAIISEFGRTPKINAQAGRDHWSDVFSLMLTGGGLKTGHILGTSNARAEIPQDRPIHYNDVLATIYRQLGIATDRIFMHAGRPVPILYQGAPIAELI